MKRYIYNAEKHLSTSMVHGVAVELFGKDSEGFRIAKEKRLVVIETDKLVSTKKIRVNSNLLELVQSMDIDSETLKNGDEVTASGTVSYSKLRNGDEVYGLFNGNGIDMEFAKQFALKKLGIELTTFDAVKVDPIRSEKVHIKNAFRFRLTGKVVDAELALNANKFAIGSKKSYGFGWVDIKKG